MADRTCKKCLTVFKFPSVLNKHLKETIHCKDQIVELNKSRRYECVNCNHKFTRQSSLSLHNKTSKCGKLTTMRKNIEKYKTNELSYESISILYPDIAAQLKTLHELKLKERQDNINNNNANTINNIINNNTHNENITTTTNSNNNLIVNNNTIVQHIYPLGFERLPDIPQSRMKRLLTLGDQGVIEIVKLVFEQDENKNFYKLNMNKSNISYLSKEYKVNVCQESELKEKLLKQCVVLTYQMLVACSPLLTNDEIEYINSNLQNISKKMKEEIYDNGLRNIIEYELRNNSKVTKDRIIKYADVVKCEPEVKKKAIDNCIEVLKIKENTDKKMIPYFKMKRLNRRLGDPLENPDMDEEEAFMDFTLNRFEYTKYYIYWTKRIEDEEHLINTSPNKTVTDIINLDSRKKNINVKLEYMKEISDSIGKVDSNNISIVTINNFYVKIAEEYIIENNRKQNMGDRYNYNSEAEETDDIDEEVPEEEEAIISIEDNNELTN